MKTTEADTTNIQHEKNAPISGTASDVGGVISATILKKKQTERRIVISEKKN